MSKDNGAIEFFFYERISWDAFERFIINLNLIDRSFKSAKEDGIWLIPSGSDDFDYEFLNLGLIEFLELNKNKHEISELSAFSLHKSDEDIGEELHIFTRFKDSITLLLPTVCRYVDGDVTDFSWYLKEIYGYMDRSFGVSAIQCRQSF